MGNDHYSHFSIHEDDDADRHEEHQSTSSELPAEIPDSQPEPYHSYLPAEIPDSQPDPNHSYLPAEIPDSQSDPYFSHLPAEIPDSQSDSGYRVDPDYSEVSSQLPTRDFHLVDAQAFDLGDYDLREEESLNPSDFDLANQENIDPCLSHFDDFGREKADDSDHDEAVSSPSTRDTELIPGGTRLTERRKDHLVSLYHRRPLPIIFLSICRRSS